MWNTTTALNTTEINPSGSQVPEWVELIPIGEVIGRDGRRWTNNSPQGVIRAFLNGHVDLPIDMEHATELKAPQGNPAPAVGWVKELKIRDKAIWGRVAWTRFGSQLIATRQYRYLSPVLLCSKANGTIAALSSVGLTNRPNLHLRALNSYDNGQVDVARALNAMEQEICAKMGLSKEEFLGTNPGDEWGVTSLAYAGQLSDEEREICRRMGITEEAYLKTAI